MKLTEVQKKIVRIMAALIAMSITVTALASEMATIAQRDWKFQTKAVNIAVGDTILLTNEEPFIHQLYARSPSFTFSSEEQTREEFFRSHSRWRAHSKCAARSIRRCW
jgi:plastocyanin